MMITSATDMNHSQPKRSVAEIESDLHQVFALYDLERSFETVKSFKFYLQNTGPWWRRGWIATLYRDRNGKGTHAAITLKSAGPRQGFVNLALYYLCNELMEAGARNTPSGMYEKSFHPRFSGHERAAALPKVKALAEKVSLNIDQDRLINGLIEDIRKIPVDERWPLDTEHGQLILQPSQKIRSRRYQPSYFSYRYPKGLPPYYMSKDLDFNGSHFGAISLPVLGLLREASAAGLHYIDLVVNQGEIVADL